MCGNAARCSVLFVSEVFNLSNYQLLTGAGEVTGRLNNNEPSVEWTIASSKTKAIEVEITKGAVKGLFINTGVPHFVVFESPSKFTKEECLEIQQHEQFQPQETNVTVLDDSAKPFKTKTFERGVRDFTLACGTGVIASSCVLKEKKPQKEYSLLTPGGELKVQLNNDKVRLFGPTKFVFSGNFNLNS